LLLPPSFILSFFLSVPLSPLSFIQCPCKVTAVAMLVLAFSVACPQFATRYPRILLRTSPVAEYKILKENPVIRGSLVSQLFGSPIFS
jgi:hypothetical protein